MSPEERARVYARPPLTTALLDFFPDALAAVAIVSMVCADQHDAFDNGQPVHVRDNGPHNDHANSLLRHLMARGSTDHDGLLHTAKAAWRALALLQDEIEASVGVSMPLPRAARAALVSEPEKEPVKIPAFLREPKTA